jgi:hypothetical protein
MLKFIPGTFSPQARCLWCLPARKNDSAMLVISSPGTACVRRVGAALKEVEYAETSRFVSWSGHTLIR